MAFCSFLRRGYREGDAELSSPGSHGSELHQGRFRLDVRKHFITRGEVRY